LDGEERRLIYIFLGLFFFLLSGVLFWAFTTDDWRLSTFVSKLLVSFLFSMFLMGLFIIRFFRGKGIVRLERIVRKMALISLAFGVIFAVVLAWAISVDSADAPEGEPDGTPIGPIEWAFALVGFYIAGIIAGLIAMLVVFVAGMGVVGVIYLFQVGLTPIVLTWIRDITGGGGTGSKVMGWAFMVPEVLDSSTLRASRPTFEERFPRGRFRYAASWQILFAIVVAIYVSLNPFLKDFVDAEEMWEIMTNAHIIIPILFLPTLIFLRLVARIEGPAKDFQLHDGVKTRLSGLLIAIGTLVIFVRLALEEIDLWWFVVQFITYGVISTTFILTFTFLYYNYFEWDLANKMVERAPWLFREEESSEVEGEEKEDLPGEASTGTEERPPA
jgi:hypothetical protein